MPTTPYQSGYLVELKAKDTLKELGATHVVRSSRSLTPIDLIAIFQDKKEIWLVQVKGKREAPKDLSKLRKEFKSLRALRGEYTVSPYVYMKKEGRYTFMEV